MMRDDDFDLATFLCIWQSINRDRRDSLINHAMALYGDHLRDRHPNNGHRLALGFKDLGYSAAELQPEVRLFLTGFRPASAEGSNVVAFPGGRA